MQNSGTVGKISDCHPGGLGFNPWPGGGLNFRQPFFITSSVDRDIRLLVLSQCFVGGLRRTYALVDTYKSRLMPVLQTVNSSPVKGEPKISDRNFLLQFPGFVRALEILGNPGKALDFFYEALENLTELY